MSDPTIDELTTPLTSDEVKATAYSALTTVGVDTTIWKPGAVIRTLLAIFAILFAAFTAWAAKAVRAGFILLSNDPGWIRSSARLDYGTEYFPATFATGPYTLTNAGAGVYSWGPGELLVSATLTVRGESVVKFYRNQDAVSLGASTSVSFTVIADEIGADSTAPANTITTLVPAIADLSGTNPSAVIGRDDEENQTLVNRALAQASTVSPAGPGDAYRAVLTSTVRADGSQIANRVKVVPGNPVHVYAASDAGTISGGDLAILDAKMQTAVVPLGVTATVTSAASTTVNATIAVAMYESAETDANIRTAITAAVIKAVRDLPIGGDPPYDGSGNGNLYLELFRTAAKSVSPSIFNVSVSSPVGDSVVAYNADVTLGTLTISITRYPRV